MSNNPEISGDEAIDAQLVEAVQMAGRGDQAAYARLVERHQGKVLANCRYLTRSPDDAEDLAQEVFVKAFFGLQRLKDISKFAGWLKRIKVNHCLNFVRKRKQAVMVELDGEATVTAPELQVEAEVAGDIETRRRRQRIREVLDSMSDTLRIPLLLCDMDGLSYQEAADELGIGLSAFKMRLKRARETFRTAFDEPVGSASVEAGSETQ